MEKRASFPPLPPGCETQPVWTYHDPTGRFIYELDRVYRRAAPSEQHGSSRRLEEDLSFWCVTWTTLAGTANEHAAGRWMTYAQARTLRGAPFTFEQFSSFLEMRDELAGLLAVDGAAGEPEVAPVPGLALLNQPS